MKMDDGPKAIPQQNRIAPAPKVAQLSLRAHMIAAATLVMAPLIFWTAYSNYLVLSTKRAAAENNITAAAIEGARDFDRLIGAGALFLEAVAEEADDNPAQCKSAYQEFLKAERHYISLQILGREGQNYCSYAKTPITSENPVPATPVEAEWFQSAVKAGGLSVSQVLLTPRSKRWVVVIGRPIAGGAGEPAVFAFLGIDLVQASSDFFAGRTDDSKLNIVDGAGRIAIRSPLGAEYIGRTLITENQVPLGDDPIIYDSHTRDGSEISVARVRVKNADFSAAVSVARLSFIKEYLTSTNSVLAMVGIAICVGIAMAGASRSIVRPFNQLASALQGGAAELKIEGRLIPREVAEAVNSLISLNRNSREAEARLGLVLELSPTPSLMATAQGRLTFVNRSFVETFGYSLCDVSTVDEMLGLIFPENQAASIVRAAWESLESGEVGRMGLQSAPVLLNVKSRANQRLVGLVTAAVLPEGQLGTRRLNIVDVTEIDRARKSSWLYEQVWKQSSDYMIVADTEGNIIDVNPACAAALGLPADELKGRSATRFLAEPDAPALTQTHREMAGMHEPAVMKRVLRAADGNLIKITVNLQNLTDESGKVSRRLVIARNISQEERRIEVLERYSNLVETARDPIIMVDRSGKIVFSNASTTQIFGYEASELIGHSINILIPNASRIRHQDLIESFFKSSDKSRGMATFRSVAGRSKGGESLTLQVAISKSGQGQDELATAVIRDMTAYQIMQDKLRQSDKLAAIGQLAGGVAHDFNNILAVVLGSAELIQDSDELPTRTRKLTSRIIESAVRGAELVHRLLAFSRKSPIEPVRLDLDNYLVEFVGTLTRVLGARIKIIYTPPEAPLWVLVDRSMLESSLLNICINARDAMSDGGALTIALSTETREGLAGITEWAVIAISDTGAGMSEEIRQRVFEPFFTTKKQGSGTGLGLSMVYGFVQQSGGSIEVESTPGVGSKFVLRLPTVNSVESRDAAAEVTAIGSGKHTVLVVEDSVLVRKTLAQQIDSLHHAVFEASSIAEAKAVLSVNPKVTFVISDLDLGVGETGVDLIDWMAANGSMVPGCILTGYLNTPTDRITVHGWTLIQKPVKIDQLRHLLATHAPPRKL